MKNRRLIFTYIRMLILMIFMNLAYASAAEMIISVFDDVGTPLQKVKICIENRSHDLNNICYETDEAGQVIIPFLHTGEYMLTAQRSGFTKEETGWFKVREENILEITVYLIPKTAVLKTVPRRERVIVNVRRSTSALYSGSPDELMGNEENTARILAHFPMMALDTHERPFFRGSRISESVFFLDGIPLDDPMDGGVFMLPPAGFLEDIQIGAAGFPPYMDVSSGGFIELESRRWKRRGLHVDLKGNLEFSDTFLDTDEAEEAFDFWETQRTGGDSFDFDRHPTNFGWEGDVGIQWNQGRHFGIVSGQWRKADHGLTSDYISDDADENYNLWMKYQYVSENFGQWKFMVGAENRWNRPVEPYRMRLEGPLFRHDRKGLVATDWIFIKPQDYMIRVQLIHKSGHDRAGPPETRSAFKAVEDWGTSGFDGFPDIRFLRDGEYSEDRLNGLMKMPGLTHHVSMGGSLWILKSKWIETAEIDNPDINDIGKVSWKQDDREWFFSLWGRDRWFPTSHLEIMMALKWDRMNYLDKPDYVSPRFQISYRRFGFDFYGGMERIVHPPGMVFLASRIKTDTGAMESETPEIKPELGFRWFGGTCWTYHSRLKFDVNVYYVLLTQSIVMMVEKAGDFQVYYPLVRDGGHKNGASLLTEYRFHRNFKMLFLYRWNASKLSDVNNSRRSRIEYRTGTHYSTYQPDKIPVGAVKPEMDSKHVASLILDYTCRWLASTRFRLDLVYRSGIPYFAESTDAENGWMQKNGKDSWDTAVLISKAFNLTSQVRIEGSFSVRNLFNSFQDAPTDAVSGDTVFNPYTENNGLPRTFVLGIGVYF